MYLDANNLYRYPMVGFKIVKKHDKVISFDYRIAETKKSSEVSF